LGAAPLVLLRFFLFGFSSSITFLRFGLFFFFCLDD
jgi:hypothetical protein